MAYTYHGRDGLIKTGEAITVLPSGLIQKKVTVVGRKKNTSPSIWPVPVYPLYVLTERETQKKLGSDFFAYPASSPGTDLNNGFIRYDLVGYGQSYLVDNFINYKYSKISSYVVEDQVTPFTQDILVEVGVRSTIVLSNGIKDFVAERGTTVARTTYEPPKTYFGELYAYTFEGNKITSIPRVELYNYPDRRVTKFVEYRPVQFIESVSSTYYGHYTEYITSSSLKIVRFVITESTLIL
jgi:hypothetical protein